MIFFNIFLVFLISHRALSTAVTAQDDTPTNEVPQCQSSQQIFHIYNAGGCENVQKPTKIPDGYTLIPGVGAYKLHLESKNWNDARNTCIKEGAHLSVIGSAKEEEIFAKLTTDNKLHQTWIGVHELFKDGDWVTVQDKPLDNVGYKHWKEGEPNHLYENTEHCVTYVQNEGMNDLRCNIELSFFCEIRFA